MSEGLLARARRLVEVGADSAVAMAERLTGTGLMRQAIRDVDSAIEQVRRQRGAALGPHAHAIERQRRAGEHAAQARDDARFAATAGRDDLAKAALMTRQAADADAAMAADEAMPAETDLHRSDSALDELTARRTTLVSELRAVEKVERGAGASFTPNIDRKVVRAEESFARALGMVTGSDGRPAPASGVVDALRREQLLTDELNALKSELESPPVAKRRR